jgi:hypothetical protein
MGEEVVTCALLAANPVSEVQLTLTFPAADQDALHAWDRIVDSLHLGEGVVLVGPADHWTRRQPN